MRFVICGRKTQDADIKARRYRRENPRIAGVWLTGLKTRRYMCYKEKRNQENDAKSEERADENQEDGWKPALPVRIVRTWGAGVLRPYKEKESRCSIGGACMSSEAVGEQGKDGGTAGVMARP